MTYQKAVEFLLGLELFGIKLGLENITKFLARIGNPQNSFRSIHIAGTNGKGSVASIFEAILMEAGYKVGKFTSPHLYDFRERIHINKKKISRSWVQEFVSRHKSYIEGTRATFFETCTALAFESFRSEKVDWGVIEVGLGGRLDATNLVTPELTAITKISLDHMRILGDSIEKIAFEKAGIIKPDIPVVTSTFDQRALKVIRKVAKERSTKVYNLEPKEMLEIQNMTLRQMDFSFGSNAAARNDFSSNLIGAHQAENCALAILGTELLAQRGINLPISPVAAGLKKIFWPARLQFVRRKPALLLDCAHNPDGIRALASALETLYPGKKFVVLLGMLARPDYPEIFAALGKIARQVILTIPHNDRAPEPEFLAREAINAGLNFKLIMPVLDAYAYARGLVAAGDMLVATGSHYSLGEIMKFEKIPT